MAAIAACLDGLTRASPDGAIIVHGDELYCDVARTVGYLKAVRGEAVDVRDCEALLALFREHGPQIRVFHFESCTNPSGQMFDLELLPALRKLAPHCVVVCDNTWLTGVLFNPFDHGVDLVVESCTKYLSGSQCIGGVVCGAHDAMEHVLEWCRTMGQYVPPTVADCFTAQLRSIEHRVRTAGAVAAVVATRLELKAAAARDGTAVIAPALGTVLSEGTTNGRSGAFIDRIMYPLLRSHPTHAIAAQLLQRGGPPCLWLHLSSVSKNSLCKRLAKHGCAGLAFKTSFGGPDTRVDPWPAAQGKDAYEATSIAPPKGGCWIRLAVGFEDSADGVMAALDALEQLMVAATPYAPARKPASPQAELSGCDNGGGSGSGMA
jgi:cystathionine beta-lyase/cystathionine gamma-synthase